MGFYGSTVGLDVAERDAYRAHLRAGDEDVLVLVGDPEARPPGHHAGLYHVALLYPSREELARAATRLETTRTPIQGASDHGTHEAIYLADADGNGLELAADRPRDRWPTAEEMYSRGPQPLDIQGLLGTVGGAQAEGRAEGLAVGHLHLQVGDIEQGLGFYRDLIGFELQARLPSAAFVSAGGYHHHLGFNTWLGEGIPPMPDDVVGLREWTILLPSPTDVDAVAERLGTGGVATSPTERGFVARDPWRIPARIESAPG